MGRFVERVWRLFGKGKIGEESSEEIAVKMHQTIKKVTGDIENYRYNTAISAVMEYVNVLYEGEYGKEQLMVLCKLIAPFAPHLAEEIWVERLGEEFSVFNSSWPKWNEGKIVGGKVSISVSVNGKLRERRWGTKNGCLSYVKTMKNLKSGWMGGRLNERCLCLVGR
jgi:leucyl-tRNA synthetase